MSIDMDIKLKTLLDITSDFSKKQVVAPTRKSGRYGQVYKGWYKDKEIAMKKIDPKVELDDENFKNELRNLGGVQHENVVELVGFCHGLKSYFSEEGGREFWKPLKERILCFEFMPGGSLEDHIEADSRDLDWPTCYNIIKGTCKGINALRTALDKSIFFLNIKPSNILLDKDNNAKVDGLDLSRFVSKKIIIGTQRQESGNSEYDVKSLGELIIKLICGNSWYESYCKWTDTEFAEHVEEKWKKKPEELDGPLRKIESLQVKKCVVLALNCALNDLNKRPSMEDIVRELEHDQVQSEFSFPDRLQPSGPRRKQAVVIFYAFDCSYPTTAWYTVDAIFWMVHEKLTHYIDSCMGYIYYMTVGDKYTSDMKQVDPEENKENGYIRSSKWCKEDFKQNMQAGLEKARKMISDNIDCPNGLILFFSDGLKHEESFFDVEKFKSKVPVHTFTLGGDKYNEGLHAIAANSEGGFHSAPVPERPRLSARFSSLLDSIIHGTEEPPPTSSSETQQRLDVVLVYAFDCTNSTTPTWATTDDSIFWMVQKSLTRSKDSCLGYIYPKLTPNNFTTDMKVVDHAESKATGYTPFDWRRIPCTKDMASGLKEANKMLRNRDNTKGIILFFSDGLINKLGDFFDGTEAFKSEFPVHTFTLGGDAYNKDLRAIATNSEGGKFHNTPVPERPRLSPRFSSLLDSIIHGTEEPPTSSSETQQRLDVVLVYAFDCTDSTPAWATMDHSIFWMVQRKLTRSEDSCMGYIYPMLTPNNYTTDMKVVDRAESKATGYTAFDRRRLTCTKDMASGLKEANKMLKNRDNTKGIILFFSDGLINKGDFFDGTEAFKSEFPVHTFTLGGDAYNKGLQAIAEKSGGKFHPIPVPKRPELSAHFSRKLDSIVGNAPVPMTTHSGDATTSERARPVRRHRPNVRRPFPSLPCGMGRRMNTTEEE